MLPKHYQSLFCCESYCAWCLHCFYFNDKISKKRNESILFSKMLIKLKMYYYMLWF